jgi:hypothetical protein
MRLLSVDGIVLPLTLKLGRKPYQLFHNVEARDEISEHHLQNALSLLSSVQCIYDILS